jgi:HD-like signal output (HDOD) protein
MSRADDFKQAILAVDALGATPSVLVKVAEMTKDPNTEIQSICSLLRNDGPLVAEIIRISNSPYYAPATAHSNLHGAINYIGLRGIMRLVNLSLSRRLFARDLNSYGISARDYWSDSVAAALLLEALAKRSELNSDDAYTLGILHAIGRVLINRVIEEKGYTIFWDSQGHQPIEEWERDAVGFDFAESGAMLLEHWRFPSQTCDFIRWQIHPDKVVMPVSLLGALQFARKLLELTGPAFKKQGWSFPEKHPFVRASGLTADETSRMILNCRDDFQRILKSMDLKF